MVVLLAVFLIRIRIIGGNLDPDPDPGGDKLKY